MKAKLLIVVIYVFCELNVCAQLVFQKTYGDNFEYGLVIHQTADGGYIIQGGTGSFGAGQEDIYLIKTDAHGEAIWTKTFGSYQEDYGYSMEQTLDGGYVIAGATLNFGSYWSTGYVIKTNGSGDTLWTKIYKGPYSFFPTSIQQTPDSGFIIVGVVANWDAGTDWDVFILKTNATGDPIWTKTYGGINDDTGIRALVTADGGYLVTGYTMSFGAGDEDIYLIKTDATGDILWTKTFGGDGADIGYSIQQTEDGYIIDGTTSSFGAGGTDVYLIKTNFSGDTTWTKTYGTIGNDYSPTLQPDLVGGFILAGYDGTLGAQNVTSNVLSLKSNGDTIWTKNFKTLYGCCINGIKPTIDGGYIATGRAKSFLGFSQLCLIKMDSVGNAICNQSKTATIITNPPTKIGSPATMQALFSTIASSPATITGSGGAATDICQEVGISNIYGMDPSLTILPNPAVDFITFNFTKPEMLLDAHVSIYDINGQKVYDASFKPGQNVRVGHFPSGIYLARLFNGVSIFTQKFLVQ